MVVPPLTVFKIIGDPAGIAVPFIVPAKTIAPVRSTSVAFSQAVRVG